MSHPRDSDLPLELYIVGMMRERVPNQKWDARRVIWAVRDYQHVIDVWAVACECADWLGGPEATKVRDAPPQLRRYFEKERKRCAPNVTTMRPRALAAYSRSDVVAKASSASDAG